MGRHATSLKATEARIGMPFVDFVRLRLKECNTMADISRELGVSKSLPYNWLLRAGWRVETSSRLVSLRPAPLTPRAKTLTHKE